MAAVDLIKDAYRNSLGREASDAEVQGWTSGQFGGGNVNDWVNQIANSDEAKNRQQAPTSHGYDTNAPGMGTPESGYGPGGVTNPAYHGVGSSDWDSFSSELNKAYEQYLGRSASPTDLNNWWSGAYGHGSGPSGLPSFLNAIKGSGEAQAYKPTAQTTTTAPTVTTQGGGGDMQSWLMSQLQGASSPQALAALEPLLNQRGIRLQKDSAGNVRGRLYMPDGSTVDVVTNWGQPWTYIDRGKGGGGGGGYSTPGDQYSDAYTKLLEQIFKSRLSGTDPNRQANIDALNNRASQLKQGNSLLDQQMAYLQKRYEDLQGAGYTGAENEVIKTSALDPIETDRTQAKKMLALQLAAKGHQPGSGVYEQAMLELNNRFDQLRGSTQAQLTGNELARRENRNQRAEAISSQLASIPEERSRELLDVMNAIDQLSRLTQTEQDAYARELSNLGPQRLQLAMQASGAGGVTPTSLGALLTQIAGLNQNGQIYDSRNSQALWEGIGVIADRLSGVGLGR